MNRILIATDGSPSAREAIDFGLQFAAEQAASVTFVHVAPSYDVLPAHAFGMSGALPHELTEADGAPLDEAAQLADARGITARTELLTGDPVDEIVAYADTIDVDMIVVGSRGHGAIASALLGSVPWSAARGATAGARRPGRSSTSGSCCRDRELSANGSLVLRVPRRSDSPLTATRCDHGTP